MKVAVSGATGLIGTALCRELAKEGHGILAVTRRTTGLPAPLEAVRWSPETGVVDGKALEGVDAVVHLSGESIAKRWSENHKEKVRRSRVDGSRVLVDTLSKLDRKPSVLVAASAVGYYGNRGDEELDESSPPGKGYLADVCQAWEAETGRASILGIRVSHLRMGIVLSTRGGALGTMLLPFKLGAGGPVGSGRQWMSWVHIDDAVGAIRFALQNAGVRGPANVTAPHPERNADFARALGKALHRPAFFPTPGFALKLVFGEMAQALLLDGQKVLPRALERAGYRFAHTSLDEALRELVQSGK